MAPSENRRLPLETQVGVRQNYRRSSWYDSFVNFPLGNRYGATRVNARETDDRFADSVNAEGLTAPQSPPEVSIDTSIACDSATAEFQPPAASDEESRPVEVSSV